MNDITPELKSWILKESNFHATELWNTMKNSGWHPQVSKNAIETVLNTKLQEPYINTDKPSILLDREIFIHSFMIDPHLVVLENVLSASECDLLISLAQPNMKRSKIVDGGLEKIENIRTSSGTFFNVGENSTIRALESRIESLIHWPVAKGEGLQILQYLPGEEYKPHYDYFNRSSAAFKRGQRVGTFIIYLNSPAKGGNTIFPDIGLEVVPKKGNAVFFSYLDDSAHSKTLHAGNPVIEGEKWIATKWVRDKEYI